MNSHCLEIFQEEYDKDVHALSLLFFNVCIEELMREVVEKTEQGINVGNTVVKAIWFADDQAMVADTEKGLHEIMDVLQATSADYTLCLKKSSHLWTLCNFVKS